jgi:biotin synthase
MQNIDIRHDWSLKEISDLFTLPFTRLLYRAMDAHQRYFSSEVVQICHLFRIKTGGCTEDCAYCAQSGHYKTGIKPHGLVSIEAVIDAAKVIKNLGGKRICMGAAWHSPTEKQFNHILEMIGEVKKTGLKVCLSLGMLTESQVQLLKTAGIDYYSHNLDTSPEYYKKIVSTRSYNDRIATLEKLRQAGIKICCGGIIGMGETIDDRIGLLHQLANLPEHPHSVPINHLIPMRGTPLEDAKNIDHFDFVRVIAVARILMPRSFIILAGGRNMMSDELQALCFCAGVNSLCCGEKLLTAKNVAAEKDSELLQRLGIVLTC